METFNIYSQVQAELKDFFTKKIKIGEAIVDGRPTGGYEYSQWDTLQTIEYMDGSKFLSGERDSEGQQKFYLNTAVFRREVATKNIDIDLKNFLFIPEEDKSEKGTIVVRKKFRKWAKDNGLSEMLNESGERFPKYGTLVGKRVGKEIELVPLMKLRNQQDAKTLKDASYVIQEHTLTKHELEDYKDWDISNLDLKFNDTITVYERYGYFPKALLNSDKGEVIADEAVYGVVFVALDKGIHGATILFAEETECPFLEIHYAKQDGRWLGIGEMEKQIENQAARNMVFNLRKKSLAWSAKNIFQTQDDTIVNNLVREVKDGDILKVSTPNGVFKVDTATRASVDYNSLDQLLEENSNQRSFTFEAATGESMPSGTPFRLGALVSNAVNTYYDKKREQLGLFWKKIIYEFMLDSFIRQTPEEFTEHICDTEEGFEEMREAKKDLLIGKMILQQVLERKPVDMEAIKTAVEMGLSKISKDYFTMTRQEIKDLKYTFDIDITGESINMPQKMETLTSLYTAQLQQGQLEQANMTLKKIMILAGEKMPRQTAQPQMAQMGGQMGQPQQATQMPTPEGQGLEQPIM